MDSSENLKRQQKFDRTYMEVAESYSKLSYAKRLKVGCVIVLDDHQISEAYNGTIAGMDNACELEDGTTSPFTLHAEENALIKLARSTLSSKGATMYVTHSPCPSCAKLIAQAKIKRVVYKTEYRDISSVEFLRSCGLTVDKLE